MRHRTTAELQAALPHLTVAPPDGGTVEWLVRRPQPGEREVIDRAGVDLVTGLEGDTWSTKRTSSTPDGTPNPLHQITLMSTRVIDLVAGGDRERWALAGDQIYVDMDLSHQSLPSGARLAIGSVVLEVTASPHRGCVKFADRFGVDALRFVNVGLGRAHRLRGVNTRVVTPGEVAVGDVIRRVDVR
ncbi:MOSC domain-containing protein [Euzebya sp.]|uniref:MOSC domain-containing protein n=1 Tax=Euzebya sp. TaxID=1971409 RepID=UPI003515BBA4